MKDLADKITDSLYSNGTDSKITRLVLEIDGVDIRERDGGGLCKSAAADRIRSSINEYIFRLREDIIKTIDERLGN